MVDDTIVFRKAVSNVLEKIPGVEVVGVAHNGKIALSKVRTLKPDLLTLDIEMPVMNGIEVLAELQRSAPGTSAIMVSTLTSEGSAMTMKALELGAYDFILKPNTTNIEQSTKQLRESLTPLIKNFQQSNTSVGAIQGKQPAMRRQPAPSAPARKQPAAKKQSFAKRGKSEIVTIGISTGGPNALAKMMPLLPADIGVPIVIVQHMPPVFTQSLAKSLDSKCKISVKEAVDREPLKPGVAYIAPGGKQMKLLASADGLNRLIKITNDPPENSCKPSADYLFRSVADYYVDRATAVIMTGMGSDGTKGLQHLNKKGCYIIAQDRQSCVVYGMPKAPTEMGIVDTVVPLQKIAEAIVKSVK